MNPYLEPQGFLGTGASLLADVTLVAYVLLIIPAMIAGLLFARRGKHRPHHKWTMTTIMLVNWILIVFLMVVAYRFDVADNIAAQPNNTRYLLPAVHALFGIPAQLLATFIIVRMFVEDYQVGRAKRRGEKDTSRYWFRRAKPVMRLTLTLWLVTATLGVFSYLTRYNIIPAYAFSAGVIAPLATEELLSPAETPDLPVATPELQPPAETPEPESTALSVRTPRAPAETEEPRAPAGTPEVEND